MFAAVMMLLWLVASLLAWQGYRRGRYRRPIHRDLLALGGLFLAALGFFWRILWGGSWMPADGGDMASFLYPTYQFVARSLRQGIVPLWNPHQYTGAPLIGDVQSGLFYPVYLVLFLAARTLDYRMMEWLSIFHLWWAGAGMYLLLRLDRWTNEGRQLARWGSFAGALAFMFSDGFILHFGNLNLIAVASWLPWVFWAYLRGIDRHRLSVKWAIGAGALLGVATLAGHIQVTLFIALALAAYTLLEVITSRRWRDSSAERPPAWRYAVYLVICGLVALLLSAVVLLPGLELARHTARAAWDYQQTVGYSLSPAQWIGMLIPGFFGRGPQFHWGLWPRVEVGYLGVLPLLLALLAVLRGRPRRMWAMLGLGAVCFLIALGIYSVVHGWLATFVPGFGQLRAPARIVLVVDFALAVLAAMGLDALLRSGSSDRKAFHLVFRGTLWASLLTLAVPVPLTYFALLTQQEASPEVVSRISVALIAVVIFAGLLLCSLALFAARRWRWAGPRVLGFLAASLIFLDLASVGAYNDLGPVDPTLTFEQPQIVSFLQAQEGAFRIDARTGIEQLWQPNTALVHGLDDVWGVVNPLALADVERYWEGMDSRSSTLYDFLNARYLIATKDVVLDWEKFEVAFEGHAQLNVYRNLDALPRAYMVHQSRVVSDQEAAWEALHDPSFDAEREVVVEGRAASLSPAQGDEQVRIIDRSPNKLEVEVEASAAGYLVLSEVYYPGWQVFDIGDVRLPLQRANYAFRAIPLEAGDHQLRLVYRPLVYRVGLGLSLSACASLLGMILWHLLRLRASKTSRDRERHQGDLVQH